MERILTEADAMALVGKTVLDAAHTLLQSCKAEPVNVFVPQKRKRATSPLMDPDVDLTRVIPIEILEQVYSFLDPTKLEDRQAVGWLIQFERGMNYPQVIERIYRAWFRSDFDMMPGQKSIDSVTDMKALLKARTQARKKMVSGIKFLDRMFKWTSKGRIVPYSMLIQCVERGYDMTLVHMSKSPAFVRAASADQNVVQKQFSKTCGWPTTVSLCVALLPYLKKEPAIDFALEKAISCRNQSLITHPTFIERYAKKKVPSQRSVFKMYVAQEDTSLPLDVKVSFAGAVMDLFDRSRTNLQDMQNALIGAPDWAREVVKKCGYAVI